MKTQISDPMVPATWRIEKTRRETHDTFSLHFLADESSDGFTFAPGQFNMLYVFGIGEAPISISGDPDRPQTLVHTIRDVGLVTGAIRQLKKGDVLGIRGPFGSPWPVEDAKGKDVVIVTGGIGLAPLRPAIYRILAQREKYGKVSILYGARTPDDILFQSELEQWRGRFDLEVDVIVDSASSGWAGNVGVVTKLIHPARFDPENLAVMICGPEIMMRFTILEFMKQGVDKKNIYVSMERNMKCAVGFCGHCQFGPAFICKDGPVFRFDRLNSIFSKREI